MFMCRQMPLATRLVRSGMYVPVSNLRNKEPTATIPVADVPAEGLSAGSVVGGARMNCTGELVTRLITLSLLMHA